MPVHETPTHLLLRQPHLAKINLPIEMKPLENMIDLDYRPPRATLQVDLGVVLSASASQATNHTDLSKL